MLGITWDVERDCFALGVAVKKKSCSRRGIFSMLGALSDPLWFVAPVTLLAKITLTFVEEENRLRRKYTRRREMHDRNGCLTYLLRLD